jgi:shikimate kinase
LTGRCTTAAPLRNGDPREILTRLRAEGAVPTAAPIKVTSGNGPHTRTLDKVLKGIDEWL